MARRRVPPDIARALPELDAEARAFLEGKGQPLPMWIGLYRMPKPSGRGESFHILPQRGAVLRGAEPVIKGTLPVRAAVITDATRLDATARHLMRLWMAWHRQRLAKRRDRDAVRAAAALEDYLLANAPSLDGRARNIGANNAAKKAAAEKLKADCLDEVARMNKARIEKNLPKLTNKSDIARRLIKALGLDPRSFRRLRRWL